MPNQSNWDQLLAVVEFAINSSWQASIGMSPFKCVYGYTPKTPLTVDLPPPGEEKVPAAVDFAKQMQDLLRLPKRRLEAAQHRQKAYADQHRIEMEFQVGQRVLLSTKNLKGQKFRDSEVSSKVHWPFQGSQTGWAPWPMSLSCLLLTSSMTSFHVSLRGEIP